MSGERWWEISEDELENRMQTVKKYRIDPVSEAGKEFYRCLDDVLENLGVKVDDENYSIQQQCMEMGIFMTPHDDDRAPHLNGMYINRTVYSLIKREMVDIIPHAWVSAPKMQSDGTAKCETQYFEKNKMEESGGVKIIV